MAKGVVMAAPNNAYDWAAIAAFLATIGAGFKWLWSNWGSRNADRDARLTAREEKYTAKVEGRLRELDERMEKVERAYGLVVGVAHVMVDDLMVINPRSAALLMVAERIRTAYPLPEETPTELLHLLGRLDAHKGKTDGA